MNNASNAINGSTENFQGHIDRLEREIQSMKISLNTLTSNTGAMQESIQAIQVGLNITSKTKGVKGMSNLHPECKVSLFRLQQQ